MRNDAPLSVIWRRKWIILVTVLLFAAAAAAVSKSLEKVYDTDSTLLISLPVETQSFDAVQASQTVARSYADIIDSPNVARLVATRLGGGTTTREVLDATSFEPVAETQVLKINVEDPDPARAKQIADTYADVFIAYADRELADTTKATVSLADAAPLPTQAARPKPTLYVLIASFLGLGIGLGLAFLRDRVDRRLRTLEDVESRFEMPVLARVPNRGRSDTSVNAFREAHRILRTNLQFATGGRPLRSIAVTSGGEGEGKTTTVAELALSTAEVGQRAIVVEGDFRKPRLQQEFFPDRPPLLPGLSNFLVEAVEIDSAIYSTGRPGVDLVPAGPLPPSPSVLLGARRGRAAVSALLEHADLVIVDCPPLSVGADASVVSGWVDGVILVVDLHSSTDETVRAALRQLDAVQATVIGLLLNRDRRAEVKRYEYYSRDQHVRTDGSSRSKAGTGAGPVN